jgi:hypothetical protein
MTDTDRTPPSDLDAIQQLPWMTRAPAAPAAPTVPAMPPPLPAEPPARPTPVPAPPPVLTKPVTASPEATPEPKPGADGDDQADGAERAFDLRALADQLTGVLSETPDERERRRHREREARLADAGETPAQRKQRHREERREHEHRASALVRVHHSERAHRFRRWVVLTGLSASAGYAVGLVQDATGLPLDVGVAALGACWWFDLYMRRWGRTRVSQVRGLFPLVLLVVVRIPVASVLASLLGLNQLLALSGQLFHHH